MCISKSHLHFMDPRQYSSRTFEPRVLLLWYLASVLCIHKCGSEHPLEGTINVTEFSDGVVFYLKTLNLASLASI